MSGGDSLALHCCGRSNPLLHVVPDQTYPQYVAHSSPRRIALRHGQSYLGA
jgi:hypothetical protein